MARAKERSCCQPDRRCLTSCAGTARRRRAGGRRRAEEQQRRRQHKQQRALRPGSNNGEHSRSGQRRRAVRGPARGRGGAVRVVARSKLTGASWLARALWRGRRRALLAREPPLRRPPPDHIMSFFGFDASTSLSPSTPRPCDRPTDALRSGVPARLQSSPKGETSPIRSTTMPLAAAEAPRRRISPSTRPSLPPPFPPRPCLLSCGPLEQLADRPCRFASWGEEDYDGLGDQLNEHGDDLNDDTFGAFDGPAKVGQSLASPLSFTLPSFAPRASPC